MLQLRSGYSSRTEKELPVLTRWFPADAVGTPPTAKFLDLILYSREQASQQLRLPSVLACSHSRSHIRIRVRLCSGGGAAAARPPGLPHSLFVRGGGWVAQIRKENEAMGEDSGSDAPWGVVSIKAQDVGAAPDSPSPLRVADYRQPRGPSSPPPSCVAPNGGAAWLVLRRGGAESELPMQPITMMRNALGKDQGGSGVVMDPAAYKASVAYWQQHAPIQ